jgi:hypothetical protein
MIPHNRPSKIYFAEDGLSAAELRAALQDHLVQIVGEDGIIYAWQEMHEFQAQLWRFWHVRDSTSSPEIDIVIAWIIERAKGLG